MTGTLDNPGEISRSLSPPQQPHHQSRQQRQEEDEKGEQQPIRIVIPLEERQPIGLELDFSAEARAGTGVRVSRVDAGIAERMGLRQEDRLAYIGDEDIRGVDYDIVREMLQSLSYPTELMFERKARRCGGRHFSASPLRKEPFSHSLLHAHAAVDADSAVNRPFKRKRARKGQSRSPSPSDAPPRPDPRMHGDLVEQLDLLAARQSRSSSSADAPPRPAPSMHGDLVQQLDFLAARQIAEEKEAAAEGAGSEAPAGRKVPAPALRKTPARDGSTSSADPHLAVARAPSSSSSLATPGLTAVALAMAAKSKKSEALLKGQRHDLSREHRLCDRREERRQRQPQGAPEEEEEEEREREVIVRSSPLPPPLLPPQSRPRSHSGMSPRGDRQRDPHTEARSPRGEGGREGRGDVYREVDGLMASPAMRPPVWIELLVCLSLADMAGTDAARAAVVGKEVRDVLAKELAVLQRLRKVPAHVTLAQYTTLRSVSLVMSPGYRKLKSLEERYLVDHEDELAEIAEESFIGNLVGKSPSARSASPLPRAGDGGGGGGGGGGDVDGFPRLQITPPYASIETVEATPRWVRFIRDSHRTTQDVVRRALASHERAVATAGVHRLLRKQALLDVEETRATGKKTERQATEVLAKISDWEKTARVGEHFAMEVSGAVTGRAELMRDALELLMAGIERQRSRLETLATFRMFEEPATEGWRDLSA